MPMPRVKARPRLIHPIRGPEIARKRVTVIGGARSGLAVARLLKKAGAWVFLSDRASAPVGLVERLQEEGIESEFGGHTLRALEADFMVVSPGVPSTINLVQQALRSGIEVYSEIEVAYWFCPASVVAITGSNGKTTTTSLIAHIFKTANRPYIVAGNIGVPFSDYVTDVKPEDVVVLEVSSFQLDHIRYFHPRVSVLLNLTPDHLDRYGNNFNAYAQSKFRIFENQRAGDFLVYNRDDMLIREYVHWHAENQGITLMPFSQYKTLTRGAFVRNQQIIIRLNQSEETLMSVQDLALRGRHNLYNSLAAAIAARAMEVRSDIVRESLARFEGVPHRLEFVREINGVRYINDSKATNVNAVWYALESMDAPVILIAGGRDKGNDYSPLKLLVREKVKAVIGLGESAPRIVKELGTETTFATQAHSMEEAVQTAHFIAKPGDIVLLSPACASFDMFDSYEERGDVFKRLVNSL